MSSEPCTSFSWCIWKLGKVGKLVTNLQDKTDYVVYIRNVNQALNHGLFLKNIHRTITFDQHDWLKPYVEMNRKLRTETKNEFEKDFFKLMNNSVFGKTMEGQRKYRH